VLKFQRSWTRVPAAGYQRRNLGGLARALGHLVLGDDDGGVTAHRGEQPYVGEGPPQARTTFPSMAIPPPLQS
jgi:hypothetical protein